MNNETIYLKNKWDKLIQPSHQKNALAENYFNQLITSYSHPQRKYHNTSHLHHMLALLADAGVEDSAVIWATFYHDYVYWPGASDNEALSADIASTQLSDINVEEKIIERVNHLILATKYHELNFDDNLGNLFLDADMAILGSTPEVYAHYTASIRQEFLRTPAFLFNIGRKKFLEDLLKKERIFKSSWFFERFEHNAKINISQDLAT